MEKTNDTMTICTLAKPDSITLNVREYRDLVNAQKQYEDIVNLVLQCITLDSDGAPDIDYKGRSRLLIGLEIIESDAVNFKVKQLRAKAVNGGE